MNDTDFTTVFTIVGAKVSLVKMLNAALHGIGADIAIEEDDSGESILRKLTGNNIVFQLQDFLNQGNVPLPREGVPTDEEGTEYFEDYGFRVSDIQEKDPEMTLVFHFWSRKYGMGEWDFCMDYDLFFRELLRLYGGKATVIKGSKESPQWAATFSFENDSVTGCYVEPLSESALYQNVLENLVKINQRKYLPFLIESMKHQIECIQGRLDDALERFDPKYESPSTSTEDIPF